MRPNVTITDIILFLTGGGDTSYLLVSNVSFYISLLVITHHFTARLWSSLGKARRLTRTQQICKIFRSCDQRRRAHFWCLNLQRGCFHWETGILVYVSLKAGLLKVLPLLPHWWMIFFLFLKTVRHLHEYNICGCRPADLFFVFGLENRQLHSTR